MYRKATSRKLCDVRFLGGMVCGRLTYPFSYNKIGDGQQDRGRRIIDVTRKTSPSEKLEISFPFPWFRYRENSTSDSGRRISMAARYRM